MSEDLANEIEAIRAIYDERTIQPTPDPDTYILSIPDNPVSIRLQFPPTYPDGDAPPRTRGVESTGGTSTSTSTRTRKGYGSHVLHLVDEALASVFRPGGVCLFDLVQELDGRLSAGDREGEDGCYDPATVGAAAAASQDDDVGWGGSSTTTTPTTTTTTDTTGTAEAADLTMAAAAAPRRATPSALPNGPPASSSSPAAPPPPTWHTSHPLTEKRSTFLARAAHVRCPADVRHAIAHLRATDRKTARATHLVTAYRIRDARNRAITYQDCEDGGEAAAGGRLLHLLRLMDVWDVLVVVSRWYGGVKLGPDRFRMINQVAREAVVRWRGK